MRSFRYLREEAGQIGNPRCGPRSRRGAYSDPHPFPQKVPDPLHGTGERSLAAEGRVALLVRPLQAHLDHEAFPVPGEESRFLGGDEGPVGEEDRPGAVRGSLDQVGQVPPQKRLPPGQVEHLRAEMAALVHHREQRFLPHAPPVVFHPLVGVAVAARHVALEVGDDPDLVEFVGLQDPGPGNELAADRLGGEELFSCEVRREPAHQGFGLLGTEETGGDALGGGLLGGSPRKRTQDFHPAPVQADPVRPMPVDGDEYAVLLPDEEFGRVEASSRDQRECHRRFLIPPRAFAAPARRERGTLRPG